MLQNFRVTAFWVIKEKQTVGGGGGELLQRLGLTDKVTSIPF